jgi:ADP-ribosylglycohydrolase
MPSLDKFQGCIVGLAIGDALGRPTEFIHSMEQIREQFGREGVMDFEADSHPAGAYTDDTQMSLCVARALIKAGHRSLDELMEVMAAEFVQWSRSPENNRAPGTTCMTGCDRLRAGTPWQTAGVAGSKGCGSAMRTAPIGLCFHHDEDRLIEVARASSLATHGHPTALASAAGAALAVAWAIRGEDPASYPERLVERLRAMDGGDETADLVATIPDWLDRSPEEALQVGALGEAWVADEALSSALYCFCRSPNDYRQTVLVGTNSVGDSDSIACIAGAISGAYNGLNAIPHKWRTDVEDSAYLHDIGKGLHQA